MKPDMAAVRQGLLQQITLATNFASKANQYTKFYIEQTLVGFLNKSIHNDLEKRNLVENYEDGAHLKAMTFSERSRVFSELLKELRSENKYKALKGWRDELYDVWVDGRQKSLMTIERSACSLFGFTTYGVHVNGYVRDPERGWCMWVGQRSPTKQTYPNMLDQIVAGGLTSGLTVGECCAKECREEASLPDDLIAKLKPTGTVTCFYVDDRGICPECEYVFDVELPVDFKPASQDGEVQSFLLLTYQEILERIAAGDFKLNCGIICLDFLIRHSFISPDTEPLYNKIVSSLHVKLPQD